MSLVIYILGEVSSGKTTLAKALANHLGFDRISSDETRAALGIPEGLNSGHLVFPTMVSSIAWHRSNNRSLIVETTGMSPRTRDLAGNGLGQESVVFRLYCPVEKRYERERQRTDRSPVPMAVIERNIYVPGGWNATVINTETMTYPSDILNEALKYLNTRTWHTYPALEGDKVIYGKETK